MKWRWMEVHRLPWEIQISAEGNKAWLEGCCTDDSQIDG